MAIKSKIEWTEITWNPVTGCAKISPACKNCYAEKFACRLQKMGNPRYKKGFSLTLHHDLLEAPLKWKKPRLIFVNSMSDLFHEDVPFDFIKKVFEVMEKASQHTFQILTKRSSRLLEISQSLNWPENVWQGVSIENQDYLYRANNLIQIPAKVRFISFEPLIGPIENIILDKIHWVIVGGESGPGARPLKADWVRSILKYCKNQRTPFFFKQWGGTQKHKNGRMLDNKTWDEYPISI